MSCFLAFAPVVMALASASARAACPSTAARLPTGEVGAAQLAGVDLAAPRRAAHAARAALDERDLPRARTIAAAAIADLLGLPAEGLGEEGHLLLGELGDLAARAEDPGTAVHALERAAVWLGTARPPDAPELLEVQERLASALLVSGRAAESRVLLERVVEARTRRHGSDSSEVSAARARLAGALHVAGRIQEARAILEDVVGREVGRADRDEATLARARVNLGAVLYSAGEYASAREVLEAALAQMSGSARPAVDLADNARSTLAITLFELGELARAREIQEELLAKAEREGPPDGLRLASARRGLANTVALQGDLARARQLEEAVLATAVRTRPEEHPDVALARSNLAATLAGLGELAQARTLQERVLAVRESSLPAAHPDLLRARLNLATTLLQQGDHAESRAHFERVVALLDRLLPPEHPLRVGARSNLARALTLCGEDQAARDLQVDILAVRERSLPAGHPEIINARVNLANTFKRLGRRAEARELEEQNLVLLESLASPGNPQLVVTRTNLLGTRLRQGDLVGARELLDRILPPGGSLVDPSGMELARPLEMQAWVLAAEAREAGGEPSAGALAAWRAAVSAFLDVQRRLVRRALLDGSPREAEERVAALRVDLWSALGFAAGVGVFPPDPALDGAAFLLAEESRASALASARIAAAARADPSVLAARARARAASEELVRRMRVGDPDTDATRRALDAAQRELVRQGASAVAGAEFLDGDVEALAARLSADAAFVSWIRYRRADSAGESQDAFLAYVLRGTDSGPRLERFELGAAQLIAEDVERWRRAALGSRDRGLAPASDSTLLLVDAGGALRARVLDPLRGALAGARRVVVVLDDVLHTIPLDALPAGPFAPDRESGVLLGDLLRFEVRASAFDLLAPARSPRGPGLLVALGHPAFDAEPSEAPALDDDAGGQVAREADSGSGAGREIAASTSTRGPAAAGVLRGGAWERGFPPLTATREEVRAIAQYFEDAYGESAPRRVLERRFASRESLELLAPRASWLHVATHGWFAPQSLRSTADDEERAAAAAHLERGTGSSPMVLTGLALAGANLPADALGRIEGLLTAQELATLDLSSCELAVLSACDTNVGIRRVGQGVASLQRALHMAGARTAITSLWKVPDEATKDLMVDFYRRTWIQKKSKSRALWEAKVRLREARDESGVRAYGLRDWAAWVLTGDPD